MTERTAQLIGFSAGCEISITWNNAAVFRNSVPAAGTRDEPVVLAEWTTDTEVLGDIPLVIECLSGSLHFANIHMNMFAPLKQTQLTSQPNWTIYTPTEQELLQDLSQLTDEQITAKYALTKPDISQHITWVELVNIESNFCQPFRASDLIPCDGKKSITIDGTEMQRQDPDTVGSGAWHWFINQEQVFNCLFQVDAPIT